MWTHSHRAIVAEALHELADRIGDRGLQAGRRAHRDEPRSIYSAESDARYYRLSFILEPVLSLMSFLAAPLPARAVAITVAIQ